MRPTPAVLVALFAVQSPIAASAADSPVERPNVLLLCIDDLRPELGCFGVDYIRSPHIDSLAAEGRVFHRHYVQAPTCGASRYALLTGTYGPRNNQALFQRARRLQQDPDSVPPSLPAWFRRHGYETVSIGKVSHHPGGRGGPNWNDPAQPEMPHSWDRALMPTGPWQHPRGAMHGLAHGEIRVKPAEMDVFQSATGPDTIYPDGLTTDGALEQLDRLAERAERTPFFLAVGIIRPHLPFGAPARYMEPYRDAELPPIPHPEKPSGKTTWHRSGEFMKYNRWGRHPNDDPALATAVRKHYAACVSYADNLVGRILGRLDELRLRDDTIIVLWGDHGWHLGEHAVWGKHTLFEESLRSPLIIATADMPHPGAKTRSIVETIDLFPTLCDLAGLETPGGLDGTSLRPMLDTPDASGHPAVAYWGRAETIRTDTHRLVAHQGGHRELYDHRTADGETTNIAPDAPEVVDELLKRLHVRLRGWH